MSDAMQPGAAGRSLDLERPITVAAPDIATLLVDFLSEALTLARINHEVYPDARVQELSPTSLHATTARHPGPDRGVMEG